MFWVSGFVLEPSDRLKLFPSLQRQSIINLKSSRWFVQTVKKYSEFEFRNQLGKHLYHSPLQDDPLSALDVHVGSHVFQKAIVGTLLRKKQTVVLVTHQLQYLHHAHKVVVNQNPPKFK